MSDIISPFKFWAQKVLPLVYDEEISYYEVLCKVVYYLNEVIESQNNVSDNVRELQAQYITLKNYVDTYFDNLDVQEEINKKLDEMVEDGTFDEIINQKLFISLSRNKVWTFNTFSSISNEINIGDTVYTQGFYNAGDGGSCSYEITNLSSALFAIPVKGFYAVPIITNKEINVKCVGLFPSDSPIDQTAKLNSIMEDASILSVKLLFDPGDYYFKEINLSNYQNIKLIGTMPGRQVRNVFFIPIGNSDNPFVYNSGEIQVGVEMKNIRFQESTSKRTIGIKLNNAIACELENLYLYGFDTGISFENMYYFSFKNSTFAGFRSRAIFQDRDVNSNIYENIIINNNGFDYIANCGMYLVNTQSTQLINCSIENNISTAIIVAAECCLEIDSIHVEGIPNFIQTKQSGMSFNNGIITITGGIFAVPNDLLTSQSQFISADTLGLQRLILNGFKILISSSVVYPSLYFNMGWVANLTDNSSFGYGVYGENTQSLFHSVGSNLSGYPRSRFGTSLTAGQFPARCFYGSRKKWVNDIQLSGTYLFTIQKIMPQQSNNRCLVKIDIIQDYNYDSFANNFSFMSYIVAINYNGSVSKKIVAGSGSEESRDFDVDFTFNKEQKNLTGTINKNYGDFYVTYEIINVIGF